MEPNTFVMPPPPPPTPPPNRNKYRDFKLYGVKGIEITSSCDPPPSCQLK